MIPIVEQAFEGGNLLLLPLKKATSCNLLLLLPLKKANYCNLLLLPLRKATYCSLLLLLLKKAPTATYSCCWLWRRQPTAVVGVGEPLLLGAQRLCAPSVQDVTQRTNGLQDRRSSRIDCRDFRRRLSVSAKQCSKKQWPPILIQSSSQPARPGWGMFK